LINILFGNLKVIILLTGVILPDYLIHKVISDYLSIAFREKNNDYCGKTCDYISEYAIPGYRLCRASQTVQKRFEVTPLYFCSRREKTTRGGNFLWKVKLKKLFSGFATSHTL
jgi:hypothetical protein